MRRMLAFLVVAIMATTPAHADGDWVIVHSLVRMSPEDRAITVVDILHWDVVQPMPENALNDNGMF